MSKATKWIIGIVVVYLIMNDQNFVPAVTGLINTLGHILGQVTSGMNGGH